MDCVVVTLEFRFQQPLDIFSPERLLRQLITGEAAARQPTVGIQQAFRFNLPAENLAVLVQANRWLVARQGPAEGAVEPILRQIRRVETITGKALIERIGVRTHWLTAYHGDWNGLLTQYRAAFLAKTPVNSLGDDVSIIYEPSDWPVSGTRVQTGPMKQHQLDTQFLVYPDQAENRPELMFFADIDVATRANGTAKIRDVEGVVRDALRQSRAFTDDLEKRFLEAAP